MGGHVVHVARADPVLCHADRPFGMVILVVPPEPVLVELLDVGDREVARLVWSPRTSPALHIESNAKLVCEEILKRKRSAVLALGNSHEFARLNFLDVIVLVQRSGQRAEHSFDRTVARPGEAQLEVVIVEVYISGEQQVIDFLYLCLSPVQVDAQKVLAVD